jgi:hypothetical protein
VTPLNRNRWTLNIEATLAFRRHQRGLLRIFISEQKWLDGEPTEEEAIMILSHGYNADAGTFGTALQAASFRGRSANITGMHDKDF